MSSLPDTRECATEEVVHQTEEGITKANHYDAKSRPITVNTTRDSEIRIGRLTEPSGSLSIVSEESAVQYKSLQEEHSKCKIKLKNKELLYDSTRKSLENLKQEGEQRLAQLKEVHGRQLREIKNSYNKELEKQWDSWQEDFDKMGVEYEKDCDDLKEEYRRKMKRQDQARKDTVTELESKIVRLEEDKRRLTSQVKRAQEHLLKKSEQSTWISEPDSAIKDRFTNLAESVNKFAKKFAMASWSPCGTRDQQVALEDYLRPIVRHVIINDKDHFPFKILGETANASVLCVGASLAHLLSGRIFRSPFWFLEEALQPNEIYKSILDVDKRQAHIWRTQLARTYAAAEIQDPTGPMSRCRGIVTSRLVQDFLQTPVSKLLLKPIAEGRDHTSMEQSLGRVVAQASDLGMQLSCHRAELVVYDTITSLAGHLSRFEFKFNSESVQGHSSMKLHSDPDGEDTRSLRFDGTQSRIVLFPAVLAHGNDDADEYDQPARLWSKAIYWIEEKELS